MNCGKRFALLAIVLIPAFGAGCSGRNIHSDLGDDSAVLRRLWTRPAYEYFGDVPNASSHGAEYSNPVLVENTLIVGTRAGLISIYPSLNQQRWVLPIPNGVTGELVVDRGNVYFGGGDGFFYSASVETGRVNWRYELRNPVTSRPTVSGGRVFVTASDDTVYAFDAGTGKWLWHFRRRSSASATIRGASSPLVEGQEVLVGLSDGFLVALSVHDGQLSWERRLHQGTKFTDVDAHPVLESNVLYVPSYDGSLYSLKHPGGDILWRFDAGASKKVELEEQSIYLPSSDGNIYALQKSNAKVVWKFELDGGVPTQLILTEKYVIVGSSFQYLYVIDKTTGKGVYRFNGGHGSGFSGAPVYDRPSRKLYVLSTAGNLYAFSLAAPGRL
ncbi:MAG: hypothetical protein A2X94_15695 [Bdellovibrionales bacterium GWB1_55_8]|nr:MAG: hypothetical protein A2X94_15695 [Bdellovibrionales bacterium GWB1_55_8]